MKKIPYGISDFKAVLNENFYYIDKTVFIEKLEDYGRFLYLIRPRRFGKSLFLNMLDFYYNVRWEEDWELFKDTHIYNHPTKEKHAYHVLKFDFSAVSTMGDVDNNFSNYCNREIDLFLNNYNIKIDVDIQNLPAHEVLDIVFKQMSKKYKDIKVYIIIDEYDNFMNNILVNDKVLYQNMVASKEAIYKEFFKLLKALTNQNDSPLKRMFFTGVSPLALFDVTSGSNIGKNLTNVPLFNSIVGITRDEYKGLVDYYNLDFDKEEQELVDKWYNNYIFSKNITQTIYNTDMVFYYVDSYLQINQPPNDLVDINVRSDYKKLRYLIEENNKLNGNFTVLKELFQTGYITTTKIHESFGAYEAIQSENFKSLLYYLGYITIDSFKFGELRLKIPNQTMRTIVAEFLQNSLKVTQMFKIDTEEFNLTLVRLAYQNKLDVFHYFAKSLDENSSIRDFITGEQFIKGYLIALFSLSGVFVVGSEVETNKGYADITLTPSPNIPEKLPNYIIELKYLSKDEKIDKKLQEAKEQIEQYTKNKPDTKGIIVIFRNWKMEHCQFE